MVVHNSHGLHQGVAGGVSDEPEPQAFELAAHRIRLAGSRRHLRQVLPMILARPAVHEAPKELGKTLTPLAQGKQGAGVVDSCLDLQSVADDARVREQPCPIQVAVAGDALRIESVEGPPVTLTLTQNGDPGEPCLGAFEDEHLEEVPLVPGGDTPFVVVVSPIQGIIAAPGASDPLPMPSHGREDDRGC